MALLPLQDPDAAVTELRRAVTEQGMVGGLLPSTGLKSHLGDKLYWPVYAEADRLGCGLAVHGGAHSGLGFDHLNVFAAIHALGHPFGIAIVFASLVINGIFDSRLRLLSAPLRIDDAVLRAERVAIDALIMRDTVLAEAVVRGFTAGPAQRILDARG